MWIHIRTHRDYHSMHKDCTYSSQKRAHHWAREVDMSSHLWPFTIHTCSVFFSRMSLGIYTTIQDRPHAQKLSNITKTLLLCWFCLCSYVSVYAFCFTLAFIILLGFACFEFVLFPFLFNFMFFFFFFGWCALKKNTKYTKEERETDGRIERTQVGWVGRIQEEVG